MEKSIKKVTGSFEAQQTSDGAGVKLLRAIGTDSVNYVDPFLLLDEFASDNPGDYIAGFPAHPHRGFETVTYMIEGKMKHEDSTGETGILSSGSVQWMSAGKGVVHSEMPMQEEGAMRGFQLWVNLPATHKMMEPRYQNIDADKIPQITLEGGGYIKAIAGKVEDIQGPVNGIITDPTYLDVYLAPYQEYTHTVEETHSVFAYPFEGAVDFGSGPVQRGHVVTFAEGDTIRTLAGEGGGRYLFLTAKPISEPIFRGGPFVMNTREQIIQAFSDYETGKFT
ncbi:MAG: pirin family protein [Leptospirales bacterium]